MSLDAFISALVQVGLTLVAVAIGFALLEGVLYLLLVRLLQLARRGAGHARRTRLVGLLVLILWPLLWELNVSFTGMSLRNFRDPGSWASGGPVRRDRQLRPGVHAARAPDDRVLAAVPADRAVDRHQRLLPRDARHGARPAAPPADARQGHLSRADHPAVGHPAGHRPADLAHRIQQRVRRGQPAARPPRPRPDPVAVRPVLELRGDDPHQRLARRPVHDGDHPRRPAEHLRTTTTRRPRSMARAAASRSATSPCRCSGRC